MKKKKWELAAMTAVTAFLMLGTKAEAMDDAYRMPQLSGVTKTWVYQHTLPVLIRTGSVCLRMTRRTAILRP